MNMDKQKLGRVAVLMGGNSSERAVSLRSGEAVYQALMAEGVSTQKIDTGALDPWACVQQLKTCDRVFLALHGSGGEGGSWQGLLDCLGIPYTGSQVKASAIAMDKLMTKRVWQSIGLPTPDYVQVVPDMKPQQLIARLGLPLIIKPAEGGSSLGMSKVIEIDQLEQACLAATQWGGGSRGPGDPVCGRVALRRGPGVGRAARVSRPAGGDGLGLGGVSGSHAHGQALCLPGGAPAERWGGRG